MIDANSPADVLESFHVCSSHLLCIASVPGAREDDYRVDEELNRYAIIKRKKETNVWRPFSRLVVEESAKREQEEKDKEEHDRQQRLRDEAEGLKPDEVPGGGGIGSISFVSCATGDNEEGKEQSREESLQEEMEKGKKGFFFLFGACMNRAFFVKENPTFLCSRPFLRHKSQNQTLLLFCGRSFFFSSIALFVGIFFS